MRLLVVRDEASAVVDRFALAQGGREVVAVAPTEEAPAGERFDVAVVDIGSARGGLDVARRLRSGDLDCPTVVIGAEEPTGAELPEGVWLLLRPFTLADLDRRLRELTAATTEADEPERGLLGRLFGRRSEPSERTSSDEPDEAEPDAHRDAPADAPATADKPRVHRRLRGASDPSTVSTEIADALRAARLLTSFLGRNPRMLDRRRFADQVLEEADARLVTDRMSLWVPRPDGGYELLASSGPDRPPTPATVAADQPLFEEIRTRSDAVLITGAVAGTSPLVGVPGVAGPSVVAVALREATDLVGVLLADGDDLRLDDRDRLAALAERAGPQLRLAGLVGALRTDRLIVLPEGERAEGGPRH